MRKFTLLLLSVFLTASVSLAQQSQQRVENLRCDNQSLVLQQAPAPFQKSAPMSRSPRKVVISKQPDGDYYSYARSGAAYAYTIYGLYTTSLAGSPAEVVFAENGEVYLKNIISQYDCNSWVKGQINGSKVEFEFPQHILTYDGNRYYATLMRLDPEQNTFVANDTQTLTLDYNAETGSITTPASSDFATGVIVVGLTNASSQWTGFADWNIQLQRVNDKPVSAPEDLQTAQFTVTGTGFNGTLANVGFQDSDIYVQGIYPGLPEAWVKGTITGGKAVFKSGQYLGADAGTNAHVYLMSATAQQYPVESDDQNNTYYTLTDEDITFNYDAATQTLSGGSLFVANAGSTDANILILYENASIKPFTEVAATPEPPKDLQIYEGSFSDYSQGYGWGRLQFNMTNADANGEYLLPEKLSYALYVKVNGEVSQLSLLASDYQNQKEPVIDEVPYTYSDDWDIYAQGIMRVVYYFVVGPESFGVQAIYRGGGEEHRSEITWVNAKTLGANVQPEAATPEYPDVDPSDVGGEIKFSTHQPGDQRGYFGKWQEQTIDVAMHFDNEELVGSYIEEITFPLMLIKDLEEVKVWLSSQLRVENGVNKPDLVSIDVKPTKTGNVTVTLPKPYIIPEEGVYVGYTITIGQTSYTGTVTPVRTVESAKSTGLYVHNTRDILKWLNFSEGMNKSAHFELKLGGSKVKHNAVAVLPGEPSFVKVGSDFKTSLTFVNHGADGFSSLDIEYTIDGKTSEMNIKPSSAVAGTYGLTHKKSITLPAIDKRGNYDLKVRVVKVNGQPNEDTHAEATTPFVLIDSDPKHRALLEEYTGTWCQYCPRGFVALEKLAKLYPDDYVAVSYHNSDPMEIMQSSDFPSSIGGYPSAWIDRGLSCDPYYGTKNSNFGVIDDLKWRADMFGVADIFVAANLSADEQSVNVNASLLFPFNVEKANYALEYILVADGLTGPEGSDWDQVNAYAGGSEGGDLRDFNRAGRNVSGLVYNDVAVKMSKIGGIDGSVPEKVSMAEPVTHSYTFNLAEAVNTSGENLIQDKGKLRVVVLLIDREEGTVANANKTNVTTPAGIGAIRQQTVSETEIYDLNGRRINSLKPGINIVRYNYANGTNRTVKVVK